MKTTEIKNRLKMGLKTMSENWGADIIKVDPKKLTAQIWMQVPWQDSTDPEIGILSEIELTPNKLHIIGPTIWSKETTKPVTP